MLSTSEFRYEEGQKADKVKIAFYKKDNLDGRNDSPGICLF